MDEDRFDALTRFVARPRTRRQLVRALGGGALAALGGVIGADRTRAADCPSGVVCSAQCCPNASDMCLAGRCTSCPSGVICSARCCPSASDICLSGQCTSCPSGVSCTGRCCADGETCVNGLCSAAPPCGNAGDACTERKDCCAPLLCRGGACIQPKGGGSPCPPGSRECDGVCYPGGCCIAADCGDPCLVCGTDHVCRGCPAGQVCQPGRGCCTPDCTGKECGDDGCGGSCGTCPDDRPCHNGSCCVPATCQAGQCGQMPDGCGGTLACGNCPVGQCLICSADHTCVVSCPAPQVCDRGLCCTPQTCPVGACGGIPNGCGGAVDCGDCPSGKVCHERSCCTPATCQPGQCGRISDGCGGQIDCGGCGDGKSCVGGTCCDIGQACGTVCCDANQCLSCGSNHTCVSPCLENQHCNGHGSCVCDDGYVFCVTAFGPVCSFECCRDRPGRCCASGRINVTGDCCCSGSKLDQFGECTGGTCGIDCRNSTCTGSGD